MSNRVLVIGYGVSGKSAVSWLRTQGCDVVIADRQGGEGILLDSSAIDLSGISQVILSPGVPLTHPLVVQALAKGLEVIGEIELGFRFLRNRCIAITGSNGKTTTVLLTVHILNQAGVQARALGNVGVSLTSYLMNLDPQDVLIVELSSFQLESMQSRCLDEAYVLNISPNHLDRYHSMDSYVQAKARLKLFLKEGAPLFVSKQILETYPDAFAGAEGFEKELAWLNRLRYTQWEMPSKQSVQAAYLICSRCGVTDEDFLRGLQTFRKPAHRIEWVAEIHGVSYYNDSKSSNIESTVHAVEKFEGSVILIVGGLHKGSSYAPWVRAFQGKVRQLIAYGQASSIMEKELASHFMFRRLEKFADAVRYAQSEAQPKEVVLLSPGCSSYDQFRNYEHRGEEFKRLVCEAVREE